jgi:hypothetical protein
MAEVREQGELGAGADEVWKLIRDFGGFIEAMGMAVELEGEGIGQTRKITVGSQPTVERLEERDDDVRRLVYSIVSGALPVVNYMSTMQLSAIAGGRTRLAWSVTFDPAAGISEEDASKLIRGIYKGGIAALQARFGA